MNHSVKQRVYLYQVLYISHKSIDVPFNNGQFQKGGYSFKSLTDSSIHCDTGNINY